jgi:hypothetical protein
MFRNDRITILVNYSVFREDNAARNTSRTLSHFFRFYANVIRIHHFTSLLPAVSLSARHYYRSKSLDTNGTV